jgi:hypothetical protein
MVTLRAEFCQLSKRLRPSVEPVNTYRWAARRASAAVSPAIPLLTMPIRGGLLAERAGDRLGTTSAPSARLAIVGPSYSADRS